MTEGTRFGAGAESFGARGEVKLKPFRTPPEATGNHGQPTSGDGIRGFDMNAARAAGNGSSHRKIGGRDHARAAEAMDGGTDG